MSEEIAVVIPCFRVERHVLDVIRGIGPEVTSIICVDDHCPNQSGQLVLGEARDPRVTVIFHEENLGVGGAMVSGYRAALASGAKVIVKIDGDGQMDPALVERFARPILDRRADYTKGNRFFNIEDLQDMPAARLFGNAALSFLTKLSSGYWGIFDPTNGYTAIHRDVLQNLPLGKIDRRFFFESDMLFRLNVLGAVVIDIPMVSNYDHETSNLKIPKIILPFLAGHCRNLGKRIFYNYFLRDFNVASIELVMGIGLLVGGATFGVAKWIESAASGIPATSGTVMLAALPVLAGLQLLIGFLNFDIRNVPHYPVQSLVD